MKQSSSSRWWGLTGGIASGKSTALQFLKAQGIANIDADAISRQLTATGGKAIDAIAAQFGAEFIQADGAMDRSKMRNLVFQNPSAKHQLELILHPLILTEALQTAQGFENQLVIFDIPLLAESPHWRTRLDGVLVIDCEPAVQISRLQSRSQMTHEEAERILKLQASRAQRLGCSDVVIYNGNTTLAQLERSILEFLRFLAVS